MDFQVEKLPDNALKLIFSNNLNAGSVAKVWHDSINTVTENKPRSLILDFNQVKYCDGAGIALIKRLQKQQVQLGGKCVIEGLKPEFHKLLDYIADQPGKVSRNPSKQKGFAEQIGYVTLDLLKIVRDNIIFIGKLSHQLTVSLFKPAKIRWRDFFRIADETGPQALPIVALIGFLIGLISTFQAAPSFAKFGAQIYMVNLVGLGLVREMGPLLTAVLLAGRTASAFAAEIGTMKINQEVDVLKTMGLNPILFLAVPRVLVTMLITPILEVFFVVFGLLGCLVVMSSLGYTADAFFNQLYQAISAKAYIGGMVKVFVFGLVIASVGCLHGIKTNFGSQAVGRSTTQAVVSSLIMLVLVDGIFALIYYVLGI